MTNQQQQIQGRVEDRIGKENMKLSLAETRKLFLLAIGSDARGHSRSAIADLRALVPKAHEDIVEIVLLDLMKMLWHVGKRGEATDCARQILAIDSDPPPSVRKVLGIA